MFGEYRNYQGFEMKKGLIFLLLICLSWSLAAEGQNDKEGEELFDPNKPYTVTIGCYGDLEKAYRTVFSTPDFKKQYPNISVNFQTSDFAGHHNRMLTVLAAGEATNDIEAIEISYIGQMVDYSVLTDLTASSESYRSQIVPFALENGTSSKGELVAMPVDIAPVVVYYRESLMKAAGVDPSEVENMKSWDDFLDISRRVTTDTNGDGEINQWAIPHAGEIGQVLLNGGKVGWFGDSGMPLEPQKRFMDSLEITKQLREEGLDADLSIFSGPGVGALSDGTVAMVVWGAWFGGSLKNWMAPEIEDWRVASLPGDSSAMIGGTYLTIPKTLDSSQKTAAAEVINYLASSPTAQQIIFKSIEAFPALTAAYDSDFMTEEVEYFGNKPVRQVYAKAVENMPILNVTEYDASVEGIWGNMVAEMLWGTVTPEEAYQQAKDQILATMD